MPRNPSVVALAVLVALASCGTFGGGLSQEDRDKLALYQSNAALYYEGKRYDQALDMVRKGLDVEPDDYKLLSLGGWCYLQLSERDSERLVEAESYFDRVYDQRSPDDHMPHALLGYAATKQRLGKEHMRIAEALRKEIETRELTSTQKQVRESSADEHERRARSYWNEAIRILDELVAREDLLRFAHKLLMETYVELGQYDNAVEQGNLCLQRNQDEQEIENTTIRETRSVTAEREARARLQDLIDQEERVRAALAEMHFRKGNYVLAVEQLDHLLSMDPTRSTDYYNRGVALERLGRLEEARRNFEKFLGTTTLPSDDDRVAHAFESTQDR